MKSPMLVLSGLVLAVTMMSVPLAVDAGMHGGSGGSGGSSGPGGNGAGDQGSGDQGADGHGPGGERNGNGGSEFRAQRILASLDLDGSGDISLDEYLAKPNGSRFDQFDRLDADDDGLISEDEYLNAQGAGYNGGGFNGMDIDFDELRVCIEEQGGSIWMTPPDRAAHFIEMDVNADGFVDPDEFETAREDRAVERFMLIDTDADGVITESELTEALGEMGQHRSVRRECINEQRDLNSLQGG